MKKKILSAVMVLAMVLSLLPVTALAVGNVAEIGTKQYETLANAIADVPTNAGTPTTIKLLQNCTASSFEIPSDTNITLDLNGCELNLGSGKFGITVKGDSILTLQDESNAKNGCLSFCVNSKNGAVVYTDAGSAKFNLESGTIKATTSLTGDFFYGVRFHGTLNLTDGSVTATASGNAEPIAVGMMNNGKGGTIGCNLSATNSDRAKGIALEAKGVSSVVINGGTFIGSQYSIESKTKLTVNGGTFNNIYASGSGCSGSSFSNCTINGTLTLGSASDITFGAEDDKVTFGEYAKVTGTNYQLVDGNVLSTNAPKITFATNDADMGLIKIDRYEFSDPSSSGGYNNPMESRTWYVEKNSTATVTATAVPADENHKFVGWYGTDDTSGTKLADTETVIYTAPEGGVTADVMYYAVFKETDAYTAMKTAAAAWADETSPTISSITEMGYFAYAVNELDEDFSNKTVTLTESLTYGENDSFTPIGTAARPFNGTFDGGGHTITGLSAKGTYSTTGTGSYLGLFGYTSGAKLQDLTLSGVDFDGAYMAGGFVGEANSTTFTNCTLTGGSEVSYAYYTGGLFGHSSGGCTVTGCTVENSVLDGPWKTGGITGYADGVTISDTAVNNTAVKGTGVGALIGHANAGNTALTNVTVADVTDGEQKKINVIGTTYEGGDSCSITVSGDNTNIDAAGIVPSGSTSNIQVSGGDFTFTIPDAYITTTEGEEKKISVTFTSDDEIVIVQVIKAGETVTLPIAPSKNGYTFQGWYLENGTKVTGETTFAESTTVSAKWQANSTPSTPSDNSDNSDPTYSISLPGRVSGGEVTLLKRYAEQGETVTITVTPDDGYELDELIVTDSKGSELDLTAKGSGKYTFKMPAGGVEIEASFRKIVVVPVNPFADVNTGDYYYDAVLWAVDNGITSGTSAVTFSPDAVCTRAQMMTYLWRAAGSPSASAANPFADLSAGDYYYDAVLWAVEQGITGGTSATTFSPDAPITRGQTMTFLWRAAGSPVVSGRSFGDVAAEAYYADAVTWAVREGITAGTGPSTFSPDQGCTRAQTVTYLYARYGA